MCLSLLVCGPVEESQYSSLLAFLALPNQVEGPFSQEKKRNQTKTKPTTQQEK